MFMLRVISVLKSVFFPKTCAGCGAIIGEDDELCDYCHEMLVRCDPLKRCMRCGLDKKNCCTEESSWSAALTKPRLWRKLCRICLKYLC